MLLYEELSTINEEKVIKIMEKASSVKIKRITYFADEEFGSGINVYICMKGNLSPFEAFVALWLKNALWEEELTSFDYTYEECRKIFDEVFIYDAEDYDLKEIPPNNALAYISKKIQSQTKIINKIKDDNENEGEIPFLDKQGIYVNRKYTKETPALLLAGDEILSCTQLLANKDFGDYRELFLESKERYLFFF